MSADGTAAIYADKPASYFANARQDIVRMLQTGPQAAILEVGCGSGGTGRAVLAAGKAQRYVGIELSVEAASEARSGLSEVVVGNVETSDLSRFEGQFDALIMSEVLEHLIDPWTTLQRVVACLKPGAEVYASSPNAAHRAVILSLLRGRFDYAESGVMDRTHLRWFTPATYAEMFRAAGVEVLDTGPLTPLRPKARMLNALSGGRLWPLLSTQIMLRGRKA
jgi:2-polyprenyl-3-methyl-5-hydroxy-6-metoxy-1,4-benzoquinol methylase